MSGTLFFCEKPCHIPIQDMRSTILWKRQAENDTGQLPTSKTREYGYYGMIERQQTLENEKTSADNSIVTNRVDSRCHFHVIFLSTSTFFAVKSTSLQNIRITTIYYFFGS